MTSKGRFFYCGRCLLPDSIILEKAFESVSILPQFEIPEIMDWDFLDSKETRIPFKINSGLLFDLAILLNPKSKELLKEDLEDFEF